MEGKADEKVERVHCNQCLRLTIHKVVAEARLDESENVGDDENPLFVDWITTNTLFQCNGCGDVVLRKRVVSHDMDVDDIYYYPPQISRPTPRWLYELPNELRDLLKESYVALQAGSLRLSIMGARALMETYMNEILGDVGGFAEKLRLLSEKGYVSSQHKEILGAALEAGHAVTHRGHMPQSTEVNVVFDIVENLLHTQILSKKSEELRKQLPKRKRQT